jgi:hypothetical protein
MFLTLRPVYQADSAHIAAPESRYSQRSTDCQQPQQPRTADTTAACLTDVRE